MSIADYIEDRARAKQREIKYEIWKAKNHDSRMRTQGALLGALVGVSAGVLLAPKSGKETREDISEAFDETVRTVKETSTDIVDNAKDSYEDMKYRAYTDLEPVREGFDHGKEIARQTGKQLAETAENVKDNVAEGAEEVGKIISNTATDVASDVKEGAKEAAEVTSEKHEENVKEANKAKEEVKDSVDKTADLAKDKAEEAKNADKKVKIEIDKKNKKN